MKDSQSKLYISPISKDLVYASNSYGNTYNYSPVHYSEIRQGIVIPEFNYEDFLLFNEFKGNSQTCQIIFFLS